MAKNKRTGDKDIDGWLKGMVFSGCYVRTKNIIGFTLQRWENNDPFETRETAALFYYQDESPKDKWAYFSIGETTGIHCCGVFKPKKQWVFIMDDGEVYGLGSGAEGWEKSICKTKTYFSNVKSIRNGHAIAVGPDRKVFIRNAVNKWIPLDKGLFPKGSKADLENAGFNDIDGFSEKDMYACGGQGDLWHYNGSLWQKIKLPSHTDVVLEKICCAEDGFVYLLTNGKDILKGREKNWEVIRQSKTKEILEEIICFEGKVIVSTNSKLFLVDGNVFKEANLGEPKMRSKAHIAAGDSVFVIAGEDKACLYDGKSWSVILESEK